VVASWIEAGGAWSCSYLAFEIDKKGDMSSTTTLRPVFSHPFFCFRKFWGKKNPTEIQQINPVWNRITALEKLPIFKEIPNSQSAEGRMHKKHDKQTNERTIIRE
jgi:hypothetical protein